MDTTAYTKHMSTPTILTIEDDADLREAITTALSQAGYRALAADNGAAGVTLALAEHPDVILMDIMMPQLNGHQAVEKIRNDPWGKQAKVIFLTSLSGAEDVVAAVKSGSEDYIVKSHTSLAEIVRKVREVLYSSSN